MNNNLIILLCFLPILLALMEEQEQKRATAARLMAHRKCKKERKSSMQKMIEAYLGCRCVFHLLSGSLVGTALELQDGWLRVDTGKSIEAVNLDYLLRVQPAPNRKNDKKPLLSLD